MSNVDTPDSLADTPDPELRERLDDDDTSAEPRSEEALVDADTIGTELREEQ
jgi:hypothetical protein